MQYEINSGGINVIFETVDLTAVVGDAACIDVGEALNYIKTGQAEVQEVVDSGTAAFNLNAQQKTIAFNNNATEKTGDFNANATSKTNAFNSNATNKTGDFNDNYIAKKALIDAEVGNAAASATTASGYADTAKQWAIGDPSEPTGNSAKYWADTAEATLSGKQDTLVSGTNIKTINNESLLGSGNITIQGGGSSYTAGTGISIVSDVISVTSPTLTNTATGSDSYSVGGTAAGRLACSFGYNAIASGARTTAIGEQAQATAQYATAIGGAATAGADYAIQIGYGTNITANTLSVGFRTSNSLLAKNWQLLDGTTGYIPNARINMDSTPTSASTNTVTSGGVYTALSGKADTSSLATVATTGSYNDLSDKPTVDQTYNGTSANAQSGVAVASAISGKANTDLSNISGTSAKSIDGQWVYNYQLLANNVAADNTTPVTQYSLANYLPNDGYDYEVLMQGICNTGTTSGQFMSIVLRTDIYTGSIEICSIRTRSNSLVDTRGNGILAVGTGRYVSHVPSSSSNYNGSYTLAATAYRRIGTNS